MRDKLIELLIKSGVTWNPCGVADYLLENEVIVPPCKVGDTVYYPVFKTDRVLLYKVISIKLNSKGLYVVCENHLSKSQMTHRVAQIGKTIFLTEKEAERALAEERKRNERI